VVAALTVVAAAAGTLLWLCMLAAPVRLATGLAGALRHLDRAEKAIPAGALKRARVETLSGAAAAERAVAGLAGPAPVLDLGRAVPRLEPLLREAPHLVAAARHSAAAARGSLEVAQGALRGPGRIVSTTDGGGSRVRLERVEAIAALLRGVRAHLLSARDELRAVHPGSLPRRARPRIRSGIRRATRASAALSDALAGFELLPAVLGAEGRRSYLIAMQNSGELRGTGGSFLRFSLLEFRGGVPRLRRSQTVYKVDVERERLHVPLPPAAWYVAGVEDAQRFGNANWSPDWPLSARLTLRYARASRSDLPDIDGVIGVDPLLMRELMPGVGAFRLPSRRLISRSTIVPYVLHRAYGLHPNPGLRRKHLKHLVEGFYENLLEPGHPTDLIQGMGRALARKHMQIYLARDEEMGFVERMNWDGAIERAARGDYLFVVEQNVGGNKLDYTSEQSHTMNVQVVGDDARVSTRVRVHNRVFLPQSNYWLGNSGPCHRPMINVYVPGRARLLRWRVPPGGGPTGCSSAVRRLDVPLPAVWSDGRPPEHHERGKKVWSATLEVPPGRAASLSFDYRVPGAVTKEGRRNVYRLLVQRQPKVWPDDVTVRLRLPTGASRVVAPGWAKEGTTLVWRRELDADASLEVSWL
jgi:hypothetical protein